jgi:DNA-binding MarR family transcriptional regulator
MQIHPSRDMKKLTQLEQVLWLNSQFRRGLEHIGVTPLQAGVLLLCASSDGHNMTNIATSLCLRLPTLSEVVNDLVRKRLDHEAALSDG